MDLVAATGDLLQDLIITSVYLEDLVTTIDHLEDLVAIEGHLVDLVSQVVEAPCVEVRMDGLVKRMVAYMNAIMTEDVQHLKVVHVDLVSPLVLEEVAGNFYCQIESLPKPIF